MNYPPHSSFPPGGPPPSQGPFSQPPSAFGQSAPPPKKRGNTGLILGLVGGCGCLGLLVAAVVAVGAFGYLRTQQGESEALRAMEEAQREMERAEAEAAQRRAEAESEAAFAAAAGGQAGSEDTVVHDVPVGEAPQIGPDDALVTIVAFSDFQCPFCARVTSTLDRVREAHGDDVRIVFKHNPLPFHQEAMPAAEAAMEVWKEGGDQAFWAYHDVVFANQRTLSDENLVQWAARVRVSRTAVRRALRDQRHREALQRDMDLARTVGATGTPTFFINGTKLAGAQPFESFEARIQREKAQAQALVASGTPRDQVYETILERAR